MERRDEGCTLEISDGRSFLISPTLNPLTNFIFLHPMLNSLPSPSPAPASYHDEICGHSYSLFQTGKYSDCTLIVNTPTQSLPFHLHKLILSRVIHIDDNNSEIILSTPNSNITRAGLSIALGHLYSSHSISILSHNKALLGETLAAATLLQLPDLQEIAVNLIAGDISRRTLLDHIGNSSQHPAVDAAIFGFLTRCVGEGSGWPSKDSVEYAELVGFFAQLPFEWLKRVVESKEFAVPSEIERYHFAKQVVGTRSKTTKASTQPREENVLLAFGSNKSNTGVTIVRKKDGNNHAKVWRAM